MYIEWVLEPYIHDVRIESNHRIEDRIETSRNRIIVLLVIVILLCLRTVSTFRQHDSQKMSNNFTLLRVIWVESRMSVWKEEDLRAPIKDYTSHAHIERRQALIIAVAVIKVRSNYDKKMRHYYDLWNFEVFCTFMAEFHNQRHDVYRYFFFFSRTDCIPCFYLFIYWNRFCCS